ncbi:hypothetical protein PV10_02968 [Exophiala mesophila]|uniref:Mannosyltransferase n=1 Tax=Exophiala mesophila TaxID=212818 RepID=A0A0D1Y3Q4_EXOME|nr:uncharacterized protein PV10_02968 [Exophiala mesophila]KIV95296.1 hypothetical protein PV10_02968 [Exophiala mesophila]
MTEKPASGVISRPDPEPRSGQLNTPRNPQNVFAFLIALRLVNSLTIQTFFQPDEYFQALEPAWQLAFGNDAGAWITWEWKEHLRSALHPAVFALAYRATDGLANLLKLNHILRADALLAAPKALQALLAAIGDLYTWKLAQDIYGTTSTASQAALILAVISPWQWFVSTRTFSNSLETTLTIIALYNWPWHWGIPTTTQASGPKTNSRSLRARQDPDTSLQSTDQVTRLRRALLCAAVATVLRPTNILIWIILTASTVWRLSPFSITLVHSERIAFICETILCGGIVLALSAITDRLFYNDWVFPPYNFLKVNVFESIAGFYGNNDWHYYLTQGYPLLLTTSLPFAAWGIWLSLSGAFPVGAMPATARKTLWQLSIVSLLVPFMFSNISHKEVRFIYPLLPALHIICAHPLSTFYGPLLVGSATPNARPKPRRLIPLLTSLLVNLILAFYMTQIHNSGIVALPNYLRQEFESFYTTQNQPQNLTFGLLMPCHSTPWRSHLQNPATESTAGVLGWALTCEPPLGLTVEEKRTYLDEADVFYQDPNLWLKINMEREAPQAADRRGTSPRNVHGQGGKPTRKEREDIGVHAPDTREGRTFNFDPARHASSLDWDAIKQSPWWDLALPEQSQAPGGLRPRRPWPHYLAFFGHLESTMQSALRGSDYVECKRFFNSHAHDDWRRTGDVVVWCLR